MTVERWVLAAAWLISISSLLFGIPRTKRREAAILFLFTQLIAWSCSLVFVELGMVVNPVREFPRAARSNFTFNFVLYPTVSTLFGIHYPLNASKLRQLVYQVFSIGLLIFGMRLVSTYTGLIIFVKYSWFIAGLVAFLAFNASRKYAQWFFGYMPGKGV